MKNYLAGLILLITILICAPAQATHIHYLDYAPVDELPSFDDEYETWSYTFDLTSDIMDLQNLETGDWIAPGSYDPMSQLHYVTLRIDPNNFPPQGTSTSTFLELKVNGIAIDNWSDPISLYDWGATSGTLVDTYHIADDYKIVVTLTGLSTLDDGTIPEEKLPLDILNVNLEGCFDSITPVPEPSTILLIGFGLLGLAGFNRRRRKNN